MNTASTAATAMSYGHSGSRRSSLRLDPVLFALVSVIVLLGLIMVTSASISMASHDDGEPFAYLYRQLILVAAGSALGACAFMLPIARLEKLAIPLVITAAVMLVAVLVPGLGYATHGARRWLRLAGLNFQVSEAARTLTLIYVASYCVRFEQQLRAGLPGFLRPMALLAALAVLLLLEPDFGAATVLMVSGFALLFLAGAQLRWVLAAVVLGAAAMATLVLTSGYRMRRLMAFLDPWADPLHGGFQLTQSLIAIGRGEWFGVGLGASVQKLFYLPEAHNDFLFAVLAEELGLLGVVLTLALFLALTWRVLSLAQHAYRADMKFHSYLAAGFGLWIGVQAFANIGVNMGVLPTKGFTLPLMSYGRSSMLVALIWLGIVMRVHHEVANSARAGRRERAAA
jgi:cell division protein FtsW